MVQIWSRNPRISEETKASNSTVWVGSRGLAKHFEQLSVRPPLMARLAVCVYGLGFRVWGLGSSVEGLVFRVWGLRSRDWG